MNAQRLWSIHLGLPDPGTRPPYSAAEKARGFRVFFPPINRALFANSDRDSGLWLPAVAWRRVLRPHNNPFHFDEVRQWAQTVEPTHAFVGSRVTDPFRMSARYSTSDDDPYRNDARWRLAHGSGRARVYERVEQR